MYVQEVMALCERIKYKRGFRFECQQYADCVKVQLKLLVDNMRGEGKTYVVSYVNISPYYTEDEVVRALYEVVIALERHEIDEWFTLDGEFVNNPHPELKDHRPMGSYPMERPGFTHAS